MFCIRSRLSLCGPLAVASREPVRVVHRHSCRLDNFESDFIPINQIKVHSHTKQISTYPPARSRELEDFSCSSTFLPRRAIGGRLVDGGRATRAPCPCLGAAGSSDVERSLNYMRNMRTVKVTYWGCIFFCHWLIGIGVSRCLGYPSGGVRG